MTIASEIERLQTAKANIKTSIENKGVEVPSSTSLSNYNTLIDQISTWVPQEEYDRVVEELVEETKRANINVQYESWTNYNWNGNQEWWSWSDSYELVYNGTGSHLEIQYMNPLRFENDTYYVFWGFLPIFWASKSSYSKTFIPPFEYYTINKATNQITQCRGWVNNITTASSAPNSAYCWFYECIYFKYYNTNSIWREYETEYRIYYVQNNWNKNNEYHNWNTAGYFYIKKDLSACWYVKADDARFSASRDAYWIVQTDYNTERTAQYPHQLTDLFSDYNTNYIKDVTNVNLTYGWKLYTAVGFSQGYNIWNDWYMYFRLYTVTKP